MDDLFKNARLTGPRVDEVLTNYDKLAGRIREWAGQHGHYAIVILGRRGILKTSAVNAALKSDEFLMIDGEVHAKDLYCRLYLATAEITGRDYDLPTCFDDVDFNKRLLPVTQRLFDNYEVHRLQWGSSKPIKYDGREIPTHFDTTSRCCILTNTAEKFEKWPAIRDRAFIIEFNPTVNALIDRAESLGFIDPAVIRWCRKHAKLLPDLSARTMGHATKEKLTGHNWEEYLTNLYLDPHSKLGAYLSAIATHDKAPERIEHFMSLSGKSRADYYRVQAQYRKIFPSKNLPRGRNT